MVLVFGATGFSGRLVAEELHARGLPVRAAARSPDKLDELADSLPGIETALADVVDPASVVRAAEGCALLITTVGPYVRFGEAAAEAALAHAIPYVDIAGEPAWLRRIFREFGPRAASLGVPLLAALGYDYVPGNLAGAILLERFGERARRIDIAYFLAGRQERSTESFSRGTLDSLEASSGDRGFAFAAGRLTDVGGPRKKLEFELGGGPVTAVAIGGSEHFALPRIAPWLTDVNVGLGWFSPGQERASDPPGRGGPSERSRELAGARILARAHDAAGELLGELRIDGPNPYDMSGLLCGWAANQVLAGEIEGAGALGPVEAFGLERLKDGCAEARMTVCEP